MLQNLQNSASFQNFQLHNLVDLKKCCKTHVYLQRSVPIQPKTSEILPTICRILGVTVRIHPGVCLSQAASEVPRLPGFAPRSKLEHQRAACALGVANWVRLIFYCKYCNIVYLLPQHCNIVYLLPQHVLVPNGTTLKTIVCSPILLERFH